MIPTYPSLHLSHSSPPHLNDHLPTDSFINHWLLARDAARFSTSYPNEH